MNIEYFEIKDSCRKGLLKYIERAISIIPRIEHLQILDAGCGWLMPKYNHNGENSHYTVNPLYHREEHGYAIVEISGETKSDLDVSITWKERTVEGASIKYISTSNVIKYQVSVNP